MIGVVGAIGVAVTGAIGGLAVITGDQGLFAALLVGVAGLLGALSLWTVRVVGASIRQQKAQGEQYDALRGELADTRSELRTTRAELAEAVRVNQELEAVVGRLMNKLEEHGIQVSTLGVRPRSS